MKDYEFNKKDGNVSRGEKKLQFTKKIAAFKNYFDDNFKQNTKLLHQYRNNIDIVNKDLEDQEKKLDELRKQRTSLATDNSTNIRKLKESKRELNKQKYYQHLYIIVGLTQLINLLVLGLMVNNTIPKLTGLVITFVMVLTLTCYIINYIFFKELTRDVVSFDKFKFKVDKEYTAKLPACPAEESKKRKQQEKELQNKINSMIEFESGNCDVNLSKDTRGDYLDKYNTTTTQAPMTTQATATTQATTN